MAEFLCEVCSKLGALIRDDFKKSQVSVEFLENDGGDSISCDSFLCCAQDYPLTKTMVYHNQESIKAV